MAAGSAGEAFGPEFVAWHEPAHDILASASRHFIGRMGLKRWLIATPQDGVYYDGTQLIHERRCPPQWQQLAQGAEDPQGELWLTYYSHIFNPARLNPKVMQGHLPTRFWKNLPEGALIPRLISEARTGKQRDGQAQAISARQGKASAANERWPVIPATALRYTLKRRTTAISLSLEAASAAVLCSL